MKPSLLLLRHAVQICSLLAALSTAAQADVRLPSIFGDHMILQREMAIPFWGWAEPGEEVTVSVGSVSATATTASDGKWTLRLSTIPQSSAPVEVTVAGKNQIVLKDVLLGDVWVCSGQSNMQFGIGLDTKFGKAEIAKADNPKIRLFYVPMVLAPEVASDIGPVQPDRRDFLGKWVVCSPKNLAGAGLWGGFSAVGYYFGRNIQNSTGQPVGLIMTCWGGTVAQAWTSLEGLKAHPELKAYVDEAEKFRADFPKLLKAYDAAMGPYTETLKKWTAEHQKEVDAYNAAMKQWESATEQAAAEDKPKPPKPAALKSPPAPVSPMTKNNTATVLFNAMIAPIVPYAIKGVIWYQGESNASKAVEYRTLFPAMIADWREHWAQGNFPFIYVQLTSYQARQPEPAESNWAMLREAQLKTLSVPNTAMAVTIDIGDAKEIHPLDKWDVGDRLSLAARGIAYGEKIDYSGPIYRSMKIDGGKVRVQFDHVGDGLTIGVPPEHFRPGEPRSRAAELQGFAIAGADHKFVWAQAEIDGNEVVVSSDAVPQPVSVRYAWGNNPLANLYNQAGLPASPFRTDTNQPAAEKAK
jgi:sialate O-acetylesterase